MTWITASASVIGAGHERNADRFRVATITDNAGQGFLVIALADGAGSARLGHRGAALAVNAFIGAVRRSARNRLVIHQRNLRAWHAAARRAVLAAPRDRDTLSDFGSTFLGVVIGNDEMGCTQIGDGAIVFEEQGERWRVTSWPQRGTFANETHFLAGSSRRPDITIVRPPPASLAVFCDGFEPLALHDASKSVAAGLFAHLTQKLRDLSHQSLTARDTTIGRMLSSPAVQQRVHDDCTLILAVKPEQIHVRRHSR